jgi:hypothetical protein
MPRRLPAFSLSFVLHATTLIVLLLATRPVFELASPPIQVEYVEALPTPPPDQRLPPTSEADTAPGFDPAPLQIGELQIDIAKVRSRVGVLFPFLTLDVRFLERVPRDLARAQTTLGNPYAVGGTTATTPPLDVSAERLQAWIDDAWSRRERWKTFAEIANLLQTHNPSEGHAPDLVREYLDQNILQPYCDGATRDPRYWAMMENAADHADFIDFIRSFARKYPSSKTTTELLFLLDEIAQGSRDVLLMTIETRPDEDLAMTRNLAPDGFALAEEIKERYGRWLFERGMDKGRVRQHYNDLRLRVMHTIIATTPRGYRRADAQFLAGQVLFEMNRLDHAIRVWRAIAPIPGDSYFRAYSEMLDVVGGDGPPDVMAIRRVLSREYGRWRVFSIDRLRSFGHWCDTF